MEFAQINAEIQNPKTGKTIIKNDISNANLDVAVSIGASSKSKKSAMMKNLATVLSMTANPEDQKVILMKFIESIDGEGMESLKEWARKILVQIGVEKPNDEEKAQMQAMADGEQEPTAEEQALLSLAKNNDAKTIETVAKTEKLQAQTQEILAGIDVSANQASINTLEAYRRMTETAPVSQDGVIQGDVNNAYTR
jgi:hypothetical protein